MVNIAAVCALPLGFKGKLQILLTKSRPSHLHGIEASPIFSVWHVILTVYDFLCCMFLQDASFL